MSSASDNDRDAEPSPCLALITILGRNIEHDAGTIMTSTPMRTPPIADTNFRPVGIWLSLKTYKRSGRA